MRAWLLASLLLAACGGTSDAGTRAADAFDCAWVADTSNCWHAMTAAVATCLSGDATVGVLSVDRLRCTYAGASRTVTSTIPLGSKDDGVAPTRDFRVANAAGVECVHVQEAASVLKIGYAGGTLELATAAGRVALTCPSGAVFQGPESDVRSCLSPASGIPGYGWASALGSDGLVARATFALHGVDVPLYACTYTTP